MSEIKGRDLAPAKAKLIECGLCEEQATKEIGFALFQINSNKDLKSANIIQLNNAVCQAGYTGLTLNHTQQEAAITAYNERGHKGVWFLPMYRGLRKIAMLEGAIVGDNTQVIYEGDDWEIDAGSFNKPVRHLVKNTQGNRKPILCYTVNRLPSGLDSLTLFYYDEYLKLQNAAKDKMGIKYKYSPHAVWSDQMYKKSCFKRSLTQVSGTGNAKISHALHLDNMQYDVYPISAPEEPKKSKVTTEPELEELTEKHPKYQRAFNAFLKGTQTIDMLRSYFEISEATQKQMEADKNHILKSKKQSAA